MRWEYDSSFRCVLVGCVTGILEASVILDNDILVPMSAFASSALVAEGGDQGVGSSQGWEEGGEDVRWDGGGRCRLGDVVRVLAKRLLLGSPHSMYAAETDAFVCGDALFCVRLTVM